MIVDFFICGVQKSGTTALDSYLRDHPEIEMARTKEAHFFDDERIRWADPSYERLHDLFDSSATPRARGEATPIYSYWPRSLKRLSRYNPAAKLILMLRHPVLRAHSHWRMQTTRGWETLSFSDAIRAPGRERVDSAPGGVHRLFSYVERGFYAPPAARLLRLFPLEQVLFLRTDALWNDPGAAMRAVHDFLRVSPTGETTRRYVVPLASETGVPLGAADAGYLTELYADDIAETQRLTGLDLRDWLVAPSYGADPMRP